MQRQTFIEALHDRQCGKAGRIVCPSAQHHLRPGRKSPLERLDTHLRDNIGALLDGLVGQLRDEIKGSDFPVVQRLMHSGFIDIRRDQRHRE